MAISRALMYARASNSAGTGTGLYAKGRVGATRSNYFGPHLVVSVGGTLRTAYFDRDTWAINDRGRGQAMQLSIDFFGFTPTVGQEVIFGAGAITNRLFQGTIVSITQRRHKLSQGRVVFSCVCLDPVYLAGNKKITKKYTSQTPLAIVNDWISSGFLPAGFTSTFVNSSLGTIDEIQFTMVSPPSALKQLADRIGGYGYFDFDKVVHLFTSETRDAPEAITSANPHVAKFDYASDIEGLRNRILVEGQGASVTAAVVAGETRVPVNDSTPFATSGTNYAKFEAGIITYTGVATEAGQGAVTAGVPGAGPTPPTGAADGTAGNLAVGTYSYKTTFVNADGETSASSASNDVAIAHVTPPSSHPTLTAAGGGAVGPGGYRYTMTFVTAAGETTQGWAIEFGPFVSINGTTETAVSLTNIPVSSDPRVTKRYLYRQVNPGFGHPTRLALIINNNTATTATDSAADASLSILAPPATNTTGTGRISVSNIQVGPVGTTARKLYRTEVNGSVYKLVTTISDNTTTTYADNTADGSLGATVTSSTLGTSAGSTTLRVSERSGFPSAGWVRIGSQVISYTGGGGVSGEGELTGIPASGVGAITAGISAGTTVVVEPHLTGVPASGSFAVGHTLRVGESINILVIAEDGTSEGTYGEREEHVQDRRLSLTGCAERGAAVLSLLKDPRTSGSMTSTDPKMRSGKPLTINVTEWGLSATVTVQSVTIKPGATINGVTWPQPVREVQFASRSLEDLFTELRAVREQLAARNG